jgi:hypothetical protein
MKGYGVSSVQWRALVNTAINIRVLRIVGKLFTS